MRRYPAALAAASLAVLALLAPSATAGPTGERSYRVHVLPDPTGDVSPYDRCGLAQAYVLGQETGYDARLVTVPAGRVLTARVVPDLNVFAGDVGLDWSLRVYDRSWRELARSSGPSWRTALSWTAPRTQRVWLMACNQYGHPDATVSYALR